MHSLSFSGGLSKHIKGLLTAYKEQGEAAKVDPMEYEKIVDYAIENGKMGAEEKLYYLIQGIGCGLLSPDRGSALNSKYINNYPVIDVFGSGTSRGKKPNLKDVREYAAYNWDENEPGAAFTNWFHSYAMRLERVHQRVDKVVTQGVGQDHDDATALLAYLNDTTTEEMLRKQATGYSMPLTGIQNMTVALSHWVDTAAYNEYDKYPEKRKDLIRFCGFIRNFRCHCQRPNVQKPSLL